MDKGTIIKTLDAWLGLLSPSPRMRPIEQIKIRKAATGLVVLWTGWASQKQREEQMRTVRIDGMTLETCSRRAVENQENPQIFDTFICALKKIMGEIGFRRNGVDEEHKFGWIVVNGQVYPYSYPVDAKMSSSTMHWPMPYGPFVDGKQVGVTLIGGELVKTPGFFMSFPTPRDNTFRLVMTRGAPAFTIESSVIRLNVTHPFVVEYIAGLQSSKSQIECKKISEEGVFFPLPTFEDPTDDIFFQGAILEAIQDLCIPIEETSSFTEVTEDDTAMAASPFSTDLSSSLPQRQSSSRESIRGSDVNPFYQQLVEQEWEKRKAAVVLAQQVAPSAERKKRTSKGKSTSVTMKTDDQQMLPETLPSPSDLAHDPDVRKIWDKRVVRFRDIARLIAHQIKKSGARVSIRRKGSHITLHIETNLERSGITVVRPHGSSPGELSAHQANSLIDQVNTLLAL